MARRKKVGTRIPTLHVDDRLLQLMHDRLDAAKQHGPPIQRTRSLRTVIVNDLKDKIDALREEGWTLLDIARVLHDIETVTVAVSTIRAHLTVAVGQKRPRKAISVLLTAAQPATPAGEITALLSEDDAPDDLENV